MPNVSSTAALPSYIEQLLKQQKMHTDALAVIESTLSRVTAALGGTPAAVAAPAAPKKRGRPFGTGAKAPAVVHAPAAKTAAKTAKSGMTANEFVIAFVESRKNPTTGDINTHWKESGRLGTADNSLSILTKAKKIKRIPLGNGMRGSRYVIA
jgi:hypothetical protein